MLNMPISRFQYTVDYTFLAVVSWIDMVKGQMEFIQSPKYIINGTAFALIKQPRNIHDARKFCHEKADGTLFMAKKYYKEVSQFASRHDVFSFYLGISDQETEGVFKYQDGNLVPDSKTKWYSGQPDNFIPKLSRYCENEGEDFTLSKGSSWFDVRGNHLLYPFVCEYEIPKDELPVDEVCSGCLAFVGLLNAKFTPNQITPFFNAECKSRASLLLEDFDNVCNSAGTFLIHFMKAIQQEYLLNFEICNIFQNCNLSKKLSPKGKCSNCKFILDQLKLVIIDLNKSQNLKKNSAFLKIALQFACEGLNIQCDDFNFISIMKKVSTHYLTERNIHQVCVALNQCQ